MEKFVLGIKKRLLCIVLSVSMVCSTTAATTYQAAAIPVVYSAWEVFVTIFALLGITISCLDTIEAKQQAAKELTDELVGWKVLKNEGQGDNDGDGEDDLYATFDITKFLDSKNNLVLPEEDLKDFQDFASSLDYSVKFTPVSDVNIYGCDYNYFLNYASQFTGSVLSTYSSRLVNVCANEFDEIIANEYSFVMRYNAGYSSQQEQFAVMPLNINSSYGYKETNATSGTSVFYDITNDTSSFTYSHSYYSNLWGSEIKLNQSGSMLSGSKTVFFVKGQIYDFDSIFIKPNNPTTGIDYGNIVSLNDFGVPNHHFGNTITDSMNSINDSSLGSLVGSGDYDIIGGDRVYDSNLSKPVGDIVIPMPSGDAITDYQNGLITYEQFLDALNVTPIDKAQGTNLITQEFLDKQVEISNGITSLTQLVQEVIHWLSNFWAQLGQMIVGVFVPSPGFFENYFTQLDN